MTTRREDPLQMLHSSDSVSWTRILGTAKTEWTEEKAEAELANIVAGTFTWTTVLRALVLARKCNRMVS
jgi:hypothetical protein